MPNANHRITLQARPVGLAGPEHFAADVAAIRAPEAGEVLLETLYVSVDPAMRVWISENPGYVARVEIGDVMRGGGLGRVIESRSPRLQPGAIVLARTGWQSHPTLPQAECRAIDLSLGSPTDWLGVLGITGLTAYFGMREIGGLRPAQTVLISGAAGGVGQIAGQIAAIEACRVIGIAGGPDKCSFLREIGFTSAIDYKSEPDLATAIGHEAPGGIDLFFDNIGGAMLDAALAHLNLRARVVVCGRISQTSALEPYGVRNLGLLIGKRARVEGFIVSDFQDRFAEAETWLAARLGQGVLRHRVHVIDGLARAPEGLAMLFQGRNTGKLLVRVADGPSD